MLTEVFNGGYHREIVAGLRVDCLCWTTTDEEDQQLLATVATEKTVRFKMDKVPISQHVKHFIEFHLQRVRPMLLAAAGMKSTPMSRKRRRRQKSSNNNDEGDDAMATCDKDNGNVNEEDEGNNSNQDLLALWISSRGAPLEFGSYTAGLKVVLHAFHPGLNLTLLSFRRAFITAFYKGCIKFDGAAADFRRNMSILLNVAETVMERHYDRHSAGPTNRATQDLLSSMNLGDAAVCDQLALTKSKLVAAIDRTKRTPLVNTIAPRLRRCTADDSEWVVQMDAAGLVSVPLGGGFSLRLQRLAEHNKSTPPAAKVLRLCS